MKLIWNYGTEVLTLPATLAQHLDQATKKDLRVLFALAADPRARIDLDAAANAAASTLSLSRAEIDTSLSFWRGTGVLVAEDESTTAGQSAAAPVQDSAPVRVVTERGLPVYSSEELAERTGAAIDLWLDEEKRKKLVSRIMRTDFSWNASAVQYLEMYASL